MRLRLAVLMGAAALALCRVAGAQGSAAPAKRGVYWHDEWPRFTVFEGMISAAATLRLEDLGGHLNGPESATIRFEVPLLDPGTRDLLGAQKQQDRLAAARLSDIGFRTLVFAPYVVDVGLGAIAVNRNFDVAAQLALIDFEILTLAGMTQLLASRLIGRARPYLADCSADKACTVGPGGYRGFLSGHAMAGFTGAGLMCLHHEKLPLFGGGAMDTWACVWAVSVAAATATLRLVADEHWASDILLGSAIGWAYGYYLPRLLHFHTAKLKAKTDATGITWLPTLSGTADGATLGVTGTF